MNESELDKFEATNGLNFRSAIRAKCAFNAKNLTDTLGADAVAEYKRKFAEDKDVLTVKKSKSVKK